MKLILLILLIALDISLGSDKKIMLVGFEDYQNDVILSDNKNKTNISLILIFKNEDTSQNYDKLNFKISVSYDDKTDDFPVQCINISNDVSKGTIDMRYHCSNVIDTHPDNIKKVSVKKSFNFSKSYDNDSIIYEEDEIVESSLAKEAINNITTETGKLKYYTFFLSKIKSSNKNFTLEGKIDKMDKNLTKEDAELMLSNGSIDCKISSNIDDNSIDTIQFTAKKTIIDHLNGKIADTKFYHEKILIYANKSVDDIISSSEQKLNSKIEILALSNFNFIPNTNNKRAKGIVYFKGPSQSLIKLKKYIKFKIIEGGKNLRFLDESGISVYGTKNKIKSKNGLAAYDVECTDIDKANLILTPNDKIKDFFTNDYSDFSGFSTKLDDEIDHPKDLNISNENGFTYEEIKLLRNEPKYSTNSFSLQIDGGTLKRKNISIEDWEIVYLSYIPMFKKNNRDEIKCKLLNKTISFLITCSPMHNVDTYINTMIINIYNSDSKKLRFLDEKSNHTLYIPSDTQEEIHYEYKPISSPFAKKKSSSGLSAGAIVAIILSILAVVVAIAAILLCLIRVPHARIAPNKNIQDINIINSTTNINN
jgi:hypothetical protein